MKTLTANDITTWATDLSGPVALHLKQKLTSVECIGEGDPCIIYPPTYADIGYNIDTVSGDRKVALVDSVGSQANRMEPVFKCPEEDREKWLVPQIQISLGKDSKDGKAPRISLLDLAHRGADAAVRSTLGLSILLKRAFELLQRKGDSSELCYIAPTSLLFGVWDSRDTAEKRPRLVRSIIRAWDVDELHSAAQFTSINRKLTDEILEALVKATGKKGKAATDVLSKKGFKDAPAIHYPNSKRRVLGGVLVNGVIERDITINLVALRGLQAGTEEETAKLRSYLLSLALTAATSDIDLFLREGCHLRLKDEDKWHLVPRRGQPERIALDSGVISSAAKVGAAHFRDKWPEQMEYTFDVAEAKKLLAAKEEDDQPAE